MSKFSVKKPLTVFVAVVMVLVLGVVSYSRMTPDLLPSIDLPYVLVMTPYPGATPEKVEQTVTRPMEQAMATLENIQSVSSNSASNYSTVMLEFTEDANMDSITVDDDAFGLQVKTLEGLGYTQLDKENVLALRREIASALGIYVTDSSFTYYDLYVEDEDDPYVPGKQVCFYCHGVGKCKNCGGDGLYNNPYTGDLMECTCNYGLCPTCDGTGWW